MKNKLMAVLIALLIISTQGAMALAEPLDAAATTKDITQEVSQAEELISYAKGFLGTPYVWGGTTPKGFDCSGFTQYVFKHFGYSIGRTTYNQIKDGSKVSKSELKIGDLIFTHAGHVGIYIGDNQYIHSPKKGDVIKISTITKFYGARRILQ